jgi:hypothetical protein
MYASLFTIFFFWSSFYKKKIICKVQLQSGTDMKREGKWAWNIRICTTFVSQHVIVKFDGKKEAEQKLCHKIDLGFFSQIRHSLMLKLQQKEINGMIAWFVNWLWRNDDVVKRLVFLGSKLPQGNKEESYEKAKATTKEFICVFSMRLFYL